jgi:hypothetical protein
VGNEPENNQETQGDQYLLPQVSLTKGVDHRLK